MSPQDIVKIADEHGCGVARLCRIADISRATFYRRMDAPSLMTMGEYGRLVGALNRIRNGESDENH